MKICKRESRNMKGFAVVALCGCICLGAFHNNAGALTRKGYEDHMQEQFRNQQEVHANDPAGESFRYIMISREGAKTIARYGKNDKLLRGGKDAREIIEWSMTMADVVILQKGQYELNTTLEIPRPDTTLIIGKGATVKPAKDATLASLSEGHGIYYALIRNRNRDNVKIINLGTLSIPQSADSLSRGGVGLIFDGRNGGRTGINGGLILSAGALRHQETWVVDSANVDIPLICDEDYINTALAMEGCEDCRIGIIAALAGTKARENEALDLNSYCERTTIATIIGTASAEQVIDINNSPDTRVGEVVGYGKDKRFPRHLVEHLEYPLFGHRLTQKPHIEHSKGSEIKNERVVDKNVKEWRRTVETPGFPDSLPLFNIKVTLTAVFEDGSEEQVFDKSYQFDLEGSN